VAKEMLKAAVKRIQVAKKAEKSLAQARATNKTADKRAVSEKIEKAEKAIEKSNAYHLALQKTNTKAQAKGSKKTKQRLGKAAGKNTTKSVTTKTTKKPITAKAQPLKGQPGKPGDTMGHTRQDLRATTHVLQNAQEKLATSRLEVKTLKQELSVNDQQLSRVKGRLLHAQEALASLGAQAIPGAVPASPPPHPLPAIDNWAPPAQHTGVSWTPPAHAEHILQTPEQARKTFLDPSARVTLGGQAVNGANLGIDGAQLQDPDLAVVAAPNDQMASSHEAIETVVAEKAVSGLADMVS